jgi:hypothetical protein
LYFEQRQKKKEKKEKKKIIYSKNPAKQHYARKA